MTGGDNTGGLVGSNLGTILNAYTTGDVSGQSTAGGLAAMLASGEVTLSAWVFESGTADWQELSQAQARLPTVSTIW